MYHAFFNKAQELLEQNIPFAMAIVVRAEKPTSGAWAEAREPESTRRPRVAEPAIRIRIETSKGAGKGRA